MKTTLEKLFLGQNLTAEETRVIFAEIIDGKLDSIQLSALLTALKFKGETAAEIAGAAILADNSFLNSSKRPYTPSPIQMQNT